MELQVKLVQYGRSILIRTGSDLKWVGGGSVSTRNRVIQNRAGQEVGGITFDEEVGEWRVAGYPVHGFGSEEEAWNFWLLNFDPETGKFGPSSASAARGQI